MTASRTILISGGGIAGLTAALALANKGYRVEVHDKAERFETVGAGIQLSPNAMRVLEAAGAARAVREAAMAPSSIRIASAATAREIARVPLGANAISRFGMAYLTIHRSDLHRALSATCNDVPDIEIVTGSRIADATGHANGVSAICARGTRMETLHGQAILFADGVHSAGRSQVFGLPGAVHSGFEAWRGMVRTEQLPAWLDVDQTHLVWGKGAHAVLYPVRGGRYINAVICIGKADRAQRQPHDGNRTALMARLEGWHTDWLDLFSQVERWPVWPLLAMPSRGRWAEGRMALIGDAAHAMLPFAAQGAAMAIEDAAVLADRLAEERIPETAFRAWERDRRRRVGRVAQLARRNGGIYHMGWPGTVARNLVLRLTPKQRLLERQAWIYDWQAGR